MPSAPPPPAGHAAPAGPASPAARRVVVADDDVLLREGIASLLGSVGYAVVGQASDARSLLDAVSAERPDLVIADIRMPPTQTDEGIEVARVIRDELPSIGIICCPRTWSSRPRSACSTAVTGSATC